MELRTIRAVIMSLDYFAAFILALILISCVMDKNKSVLLKIYSGMASACTIALLLEAISLTVSLVGTQNDSVLRATLNNIAIACGYALAFFYACYVANLVSVKRKHCERTLHVLRILGIAAVLFLVAGSCFGAFYTLTDKGLEPGGLFALAFAYDIIACLGGILLMVIYRKKLKPLDIVALMSLPIFILVSAMLQFYIIDMMYGLFLMAGTSVFIMYMMIQTDRNRRQVEQDKQLVDMNVAMMLSQIQPHFLYNALSSIRRMIRKDPEVAEVAVENFSTYLRQNLEAMSRVDTISFSAELKHVEEYLYLEKLRFGERLYVQYHIDFAEFALPPLTLQPIVENAVKHGIMQKEDGGCVQIASRREGNTVVITVSDDGVGFVPDVVLKSERLHIGFTNVQRRIKMQTGGTIQVESQIGIGTTVTITIPLV